MSAEDRFALRLQTLPKIADRVLIVAGLAGSRSPDGTFRTSDLATLFQEMRVPAPGNISATLAGLERLKLVIRVGAGRALTPLGEKAVTALGLGVPENYKVDAETPSAVFAHVDHTAIPTWAAPPRWAPGIKRLLERHPFDSNVLAMTRFPSEGDVPDPVASAIQVAKDELAAFGLTLHLASDAIVDDDLFGNVGAYMWACRYGLGFVEDLVGRGLNYNAVIEIGGMVVTGRRCAILKDPSAPALPTDLVGQIYRPVSFGDSTAVRSSVSQWAEADLGIRKKR